MKIGVLGAGVAGTSCASLLADSGFEVTVFEKRDGIGGLCRSTVVDGYTFDLHGGHVFNSKHSFVKDWVFSKLNKSLWHGSIRNSKILYGNRLVRYPFELSLSELPVEDAIDCLVDFVESKRSEPDNFYDWIIWKFGKSIAEKYMIPYNEKIWSFPLKNMDVSWTREKMPTPTNREVIEATLTGNSTERKMPHSTFYYPLTGGIQIMIDAIAKGVPKVLCNTPVGSIEPTNKGWLINGEESFDYLVSTLNLKTMAKVLSILPTKVYQAIKDLKCNSVTITLAKASRNELSWLYIPSKRYKAHRVVYQGNFSPFNCPEDKSSVTIETIGRIDPEKQVSEFDKDNQIPELQINDLIDSSYAQYAYPIFDKSYTQNINVVDSFFKEKGIYLLGRFAEWKYYNMDICMKRAFEVTEKLKSAVS